MSEPIKFAYTPCPIPKGLGVLDSKTIDPSWKVWIGRELASGRKTYKEIMTKYGLEHRVLKKWKLLALHGCTEFGINGRPRAISSPEAKTFKTPLGGRGQRLSTETDELIRQAAASTARKRGLSAVQGKKISKKTIKRYKKKYKINTGEGEAATKARSEAMGDIRNLT